MKKFFALVGTSAAAVATATAAEGDVANNSITLPSGVDISSLIQTGVVALAAVVAVALAAWGGWLLVKKCLKWVNKSLS